MLCILYASWYVCSAKMRTYTCTVSHQSRGRFANKDLSQRICPQTARRQTPTGCMRKVVVSSTTHEESCVCFLLATRIYVSILIDVKTVTLNCLHWWSVQRKSGYFELTAVCRICEGWSTAWLNRDSRDTHKDTQTRKYLFVEALMSQNKQCMQMQCLTLYM